MLSGEERRRFNDIAQALSAEDRRFRSAPPSESERRVSPVPVLCAVLYIVSPVLMVVLGWTAVGTAVGLFAVLLMLMWLRRSRRS